MFLRLRAMQTKEKITGQHYLQLFCLLFANLSVETIYRCEYTSACKFPDWEQKKYMLPSEVIYNLAILRAAKVSGQQRRLRLAYGVHIWFHIVLTVCVRCEVSTHKALCLSSARIWSLGFNPNLQGKKYTLQGDIRKEKKCVPTNVQLRRTCPGNLCPRQLKYPARDFPSRRVCFHCEKKSILCCSFKLAAKGQGQELTVNVTFLV